MEVASSLARAICGRRGIAELKGNPTLAARRHRGHDRSRRPKGFGLVPDKRHRKKGRGTRSEQCRKDVDSCVRDQRAPLAQAKLSRLRHAIRQKSFVVGATENRENKLFDKTNRQDAYCNSLRMRFTSPDFLEWPVLVRNRPLEKSRPGCQSLQLPRSLPLLRRLSTRTRGDLAPR
jgi:hypothetical protein